MPLAVDTILVSECLYDAIDLRSAERCVAVVVAGVIAWTTFQAMFAYLVEKRLLRK